MPAAEVVVRSAGHQDLAPLARVMARAFVNDPVFAWVLPNSRVRQSRLALFFSNVLRHEAPDLHVVDVAWASDRVVGGAIWFPPPGRYVPDLGRQLLALPGYVAALRTRLGLALAYVSSASGAHPKEPHWYLEYVGVEPESQGRGVGAALIASRAEVCDARGEAAYLESSNAQNLSLYLRLGFRPTGLLALPPGAPEVTTMWRRPVGVHLEGAPRVAPGSA